MELYVARTCRREACLLDTIYAEAELQSLVISYVRQLSSVSWAIGAVTDFKHLDEIMTSIMPDEALDELPSGFNQVGHVGTTLPFLPVQIFNALDSRSIFQDQFRADSYH